MLELILIGEYLFDMFVKLLFVYYYNATKGRVRSSNT